MLADFRLFVRRAIASPKTSGPAVSGVVSFIVAVVHDWHILTQPAAVCGLLAAIGLLFALDDKTPPHALAA